MVTRYRSETGKYVYFVNPVWTSLLGSNDTTFDKNGGIVFDEIIEKANTIIYAKKFIYSSGPVFEIVILL
ncbi:MAG: hypothetical protein WA364_19240 [Candidatus Nitrosopolaris sp.]